MDNVKKWKESGFVEDKNYYKIIKRDYEKSTKIAKNLKIDHELKNSQNLNSAVWNVVNSKTGVTKKGKTEIIKIIWIDIDNEVSYDGSEISNFFNECFQQVSSKVITNIKDYNFPTIVENLNLKRWELDCLVHLVGL